jgi:hypothetical protein
VREGYAQGLLTNDKPILSAVAMAAADWARMCGAAREAAVLMGVATRLRGSDDSANPTVIELADALRAELGAEYDVAYAEGRALDADAATARIDPEAVQAVASRIADQARRR